MDRSGNRGFKGCDGAERGTELCLCTRGVELGATARVQARIGQVQSALLVRHVPTRHIELALLAAQLEIGAGDFGDDDELRVVQIRLRGAQVRIASLDVAADAAEEVELPDRVEAGVIDLGLVAGDEPAALNLGVTLFGVTTARRDGGREIEPRLAADGTCLVEARERDSQVVIRRERVRYQGVQRVVAELLP